MIEARAYYLGYLMTPPKLTWDDIEIVRELGSGQAGRVVLARLRRACGDLSVGQEVAVKQYRRWVLDEAGQMERIVRELEAGRHVKHPALVQTLTLISDPEQRPALVMSFVEGISLEDVFEGMRSRSEILAFADALSIVTALVGAAEALHKAGLVHRDIKPANVMMTASGPVLMDLGVVGSSLLAEQTATAEFLGTLRYAAPEYVLGDGYSEGVDVYSIGAIAYELLSGEQFLSGMSHWARIIIAKQFSPTVPYRRIAQVHGYRAAAFSQWLLEAMLGNVKTRWSSAKVLDLLEAKPWTTSFHIHGGEWSMGSEVCLPDMGGHRALRTGWALNSIRKTPIPARCVDLSNLVGEWSEKLPSSLLVNLHSWITEVFAGYPVEFLYDSVNYTSCDCLIEAGLLNFSGGDSGDFWVRVTDEVFSAFCLGLLDRWAA